MLSDLRTKRNLKLHRAYFPGSQEGFGGGAALKTESPVCFLFLAFPDRIPIFFFFSQRNPLFLLQFQITLSPRRASLPCTWWIFQNESIFTGERVYSGGMDQTRAQGYKLGPRQGPRLLKKHNKPRESRPPVISLPSPGIGVTESCPLIIVLVSRLEIDP